MKKDNSTLRYKVMVRQELLDRKHCIMETHGGAGAIYHRCYRHIDNGVVFEKQDNKVNILAKQRPTWRVYQADCISSIRAGISNDMPITLIDIDPYGSCWETIAAFFESKRGFAPTMGIAVNDGLRQKLRIGAWNVSIMGNMVQKYGNKIHGKYLEICRELLDNYSAIAGYSVDHFAGYYTGHAQQMTHFLAVLKQS
jgi:hypothetical protein